MPNRYRSVASKVGAELVMSENLEADLSDPGEIEMVHNHETQSVCAPKSSTGINKEIRMGAAKRDERHLRKRIRKAYRRGRMVEARFFQQRYLTSFNCKLVAVDHGARDMKSQKRPPKSDYIEIAERLDPWRGSNEEVTVHFKLKEGPNEDYRPVCDFGIENRALQNLIRSALKAQSSLRPNQYAMRGVTRAMRKVEKALYAGFTHIRQLDIAGCFNGFDGGKIPKLLPLPEAVTRKVLLSSDLHYVPGNIKELIEQHTWDDPAKMQNDILGVGAVWRGLPQGSSVSSLAVEILLAPVLDALPSIGRVVNYADNFLIMAKNQSDADDLVTALLSALKSHPAGPLYSSWITTPKLGEPFDFLGYTVSFSGETINFRPIDRRFQEFVDKFRERKRRLKKRLEKGSLTKADVVKLGKFVKSWCNGYPLWDRGEKFEKKYLEKVADFAEEAGL